MKQLKRILACLMATGFLLSLTLLAARPAQAADEHVITVKVELTNDPTTPPDCPVSTAVVSATSCVAGDVAAELEDELEAEGLVDPSFTFLPICAELSAGGWDCLYGIPDGCEQVDIEVSVQVGTTCTGSLVAATAADEAGGFGEFTFDF